MPERRLRARPPEREAPSPAVRRLRRLRLSLTLLFTTAMALGLAALALLVIHKDSEARMDSLEGTMGRRVSGASRLIYYNGRGKLRLDGLREDDLTAGTPEVRVFDGTGPRPRQVFAGVRHELPLSYAQLAAAAQRATASEALVGTTVTDGDGTRVRLLAGPYFRDPNGDAAGAVVSAASLAEIESEHRELVLTIVLGCAGLLLLAAVAGYLLAGRSLRPAARSLAQQEALLADAAHELRTPIASIRARLEAAQLEPAGATAAIEDARATSARMGDTLDALLAWARLEAGAELSEPTELRLDQLVEAVAAEVDPGGRIAVETAPVVVTGDPTLIRIAIRNLLDNAVRHGGDGGAEAGLGGCGASGGEASEAETDVTVAVAGGAVTVADRGPGLPEAASGEEELARFRSASPGGTGLGLSIAARIADLHGGRLTVRAREGGGSELTLSFAVDSGGC
jgi:two-component system, OmpR family, sensor kinase